MNNIWFGADDHSTVSQNRTKSCGCVAKQNASRVSLARFESARARFADGQKDFTSSHSNTESTQNGTHRIQHGLCGAKSRGHSWTCGRCTSVRARPHSPRRPGRHPRGDCSIRGRDRDTVECSLSPLCVVAFQGEHRAKPANPTRTEQQVANVSFRCWSSPFTSSDMPSLRAAQEAASSPSPLIRTKAVSPT